ncbi:fasciclin domain-containing protein [Rhodanobacter sp. C03]|uniref:fasciclin domain-containing protein n=1 Tax=Rhodanobacter sp. C03 TaxID=1945858 RepID=UPI0009CA85A2|nr:fasciclin domain-containing protein [Rhodanobacter sp. C03]OOG56751.1 fasciclin [Rhodanobacter sp. C03]
MKINQRMRTLAVGLALASAMMPMVVTGKTSTPKVTAPRAVPDSEPAMSPSKNIAQNVDGAKDLATLTAAMKAAGLLDTLSGTGPFTVFAPTDKAFAALPAGSVDNLMKPENKAALIKILTYHVVAGRLTRHDLANAVEAGGGTAALKTVEGDSITISRDAHRWAISDDKGNVAHVTIGNVMQSNGVIFVIDQVLMP